MPRAANVLLAALILLALAPLLILIAIWVRLDSPGPVLFTQSRVGAGGRAFRLLKFRTMTVDAEQKGPRVTVAGDPRITRAGRHLRRSKLDELPQLWNVIRGDMNLVGPRPEVSEYVALYPEQVRAKILSIRPGITDPASIEYFDEEKILAGFADAQRAYREVVLPHKLDLYLRYIEARSIARDLAILAATAGRLFRRRS